MAVVHVGLRLPQLGREVLANRDVPDGAEPVLQVSG